MQEALASLVHPILEHGLRLKERLQRGERVDFASERAILKGLLLSDVEARHVADFGGDDSRAAEGEAGRHADRFLGLRYALACWLDEIFVLDSPWSAQWNEQKLEAELYGTNDRAWKFWEQARRAETRIEKDALEVFFLCVMLGFTGELREQPAKLQAWVTAVKTSIARMQDRPAPSAADVDPPTRVPPLHGREQFQHMVLTGGLVLLCLIPVLAFFIVRKIGQ